VKPLVLVVKLWAQFHGINDAKAMTISSYSLVLMVIHYLQSGCKEAVLPCLHQMYPDKFSPYIDVEKIKVNEQIPKWDSHNQDSLGELLIGFLEYYARKFDYARAAVSVRLGCHVPIKLCMQTRSYKNDPHQWKYLCVEEPFDLTNTARSVYDKEAFDKIRGVFYASWQRLAYTRDLESVFHEIPEQESRAIAQRIGQNIFR
jgi:poly(A) RNA polymerase GLD2